MYADYKHLLNLPYVEGFQDCYETARRYYCSRYDLILRPYARPTDWHTNGMNVIVDNFLAEGFEIADVGKNQLQIGDGLLFRIRSEVVNHIGVYVGNNFFLHHLYKRSSEESALQSMWFRKLVYIVRHPEVTELNRKTPPVKVNFMDTLPEHVRQNPPA